MKPTIPTAIAALFLFTTTTLTIADEGHKHAAGRRGDPAKVNLTVNVTTLDTMRYDPAQFRFKRGQTVKFVVTNKGQVPHEFGIGTAQEQKAHSEMMKAMPDMKHDEPNVVTIEPSKTKELVWQFTNRGTFEIGCHVPGHYEAGMAAAITVR